MPAKHQDLKEYFLDIYNKEKTGALIDWYPYYKKISERINKEFNDTKSISDELLKLVWGTDDNGVARISHHSLFSINEFDNTKNDLRKITIEIIKNSDQATYRNVSQQILALKQTNKIRVNYEVVKNRAFATIYPDKFTTLLKWDHMIQVYDFLNIKFELGLPEHNDQYGYNTALTTALAIIKSNKIDDYWVNIILWKIKEKLDKDKQMDSIQITNENTINRNSDKNYQPLNQILYGPPGTGKTYNTINKALEIIGVNLKGKSREQIKQEFDAMIDSGQIVFTTFHQSTCYEDFIEGIKPIIEQNREQNEIGYYIEPGLFKQISEKAESGDIRKLVSIESSLEKFQRECADNEKNIFLNTVNSKRFKVTYREGLKTFLIFPEESLETLKNGYSASIEGVKNYLNTGSLDKVYNPSYVKAIGEYLKANYKLDLNKQASNQKQNFVLIIDEINRGNVSQIFGELITLLEEDKRLGNDEELTVTLPYSKKLFGVPNNLYIIGTMNTADRSIEALDTALRRRFSFTEMLPKPELLVDENSDPVEVADIVLSDLLTTINQRIELLLDRDHQIGHSYFMSIGNDDVEGLCDVFNNKVVPLLQEYFFNDYAKIGLVLGSGFVEQIINENNDKFADFSDNSDRTADYQGRIIYRLKTLTLDNFSDVIERMKINITN